MSIGFDIHLLRFRLKTVTVKSWNVVACAQTFLSPGCQKQGQILEDNFEEVYIRSLQLHTQLGITYKPMRA